MDTAKRISLISKLNYARLIYRGILLIGVIVYYVLNRVWNIAIFDSNHPGTYIVLGFITFSFVLEMIMRFIPAKTSSMGSQKQFAKNYKPSGDEKPTLQSWQKTFYAFISWIVLNAIFGVLYFNNIIDQGILVIIALFYSVCDMICILFFCPFQTWIMHNRCCGTCRIYNWDFAMMFTPLIFIIVTPPQGEMPLNPFAWILVLMSLALLLEWEIIYHRYPERFSDMTNLSLRCSNCQEKLCSHKKQLQKLLKKYRITKPHLNIHSK